MKTMKRPIQFIQEHVQPGKVFWTRRQNAVASILNSILARNWEKRKNRGETNLMFVIVSKVCSRVYNFC